MMRTKLRFLTILFCLPFSGCVPMKLPVMPPQGGIYTHVKMPLSTDFHATPVREREGEARTLFFREPLYGTSYAWGDASIEEAAREGQLQTVSYADAEVLTVLGIFGRFKVRAYGE